MDPSSVLLAPVRAGRLVVRALDDLNVIAERARREPDPVEEIRVRLDALITGLATLTGLVGEAVETVADTVEPLQGAAKRVGRVTRRLSPDRR